MDDLFMEIQRELARISVNYGLRARCREVLDLGPDPLSREILEAREHGAMECYMRVLELLAPHDVRIAEELHFVRTGED
jgi:hypothetical protein